MARQSKRMKALSKKAAGLGTLQLPDAVKALKSLEDAMPKAIKRIGFDQTVEIAVRLGVDPRQADQIVRGSIVLPHGIGKSQRVVVFAQGENVKLAQAAGADIVGGKELADKIKDGWLEFDVAIATPDMMGVVGPLGRVLGPRGLMAGAGAGAGGAARAYCTRRTLGLCETPSISMKKLPKAPRTMRTTGFLTS